MSDDVRDEYIRRNLQHARSVGANANLAKVIVRLRSANYAPLWLLDELDGIQKRIDGLPNDLAKWRDACGYKPDF